MIIRPSSETIRRNQETFLAAGRIAQREREHTRRLLIALWLLVGAMAITALLLL